MRSMRKIIAVLLAALIVFEAVPLTSLAETNGEYVLSAAAISRAVQRAGIGTSSYHEGMSFSSGMSGYQMLCWLEDFIENDLTPLLNVFNSLTQVMGDDPKYRERVRKLHEMTDNVETETNRFVFEIEHEINIIDSMNAILNGADYTEKEKQRAAFNIAEADEKLEDMLSDLVLVQAVIVMTTEEAREELKDLQANHENPTTLDIRQDGGHVITRPAGIEAAGKNTEFNFQILTNNQIGFFVTDGETGKGIPKATVTLSDGNHTATAVSAKDGSVAFAPGLFELDSKKEMKARLEITANGYRVMEGQGIQIKAGEAWKFPLEKDNGQSYLQALNFRGTDIFHSNEVIYNASKNNAQQKLVAKVHTKPGSRLTLIMEYDDAVQKKRVQVTRTVEGTRDGVTEVDMSDVWCKKIAADSDIIFMTKAEFTNTAAGEANEAAGGKGSESRQYKALVSSKRAIVDEPVYNLPPISPSAISSLSVGIPISLPGMDNMAFGMSFPSFKGLSPISTLEPNGNFTLGVAYSEAVKEQEHTKQSWKTSNEEYRKSQYDRWAQNEATLSQLAKENMVDEKGAPYKPMDYFTAKPTFSVSGLMSGRLQEDQRAESEEDRFKGDFSLVFTAGFNETISYQEPFVVGIVPVFIGFDFTIGATFGINFNFTFRSSDSRAVKMDGWHDFHLQDVDYIISPSVRISAYAGVGIKKVICFYIRGTASLTLNIHFRPANQVCKWRFVIKLSFQLDAAVEVLFYSASMTIVKKNWERDISVMNTGVTDESLTAPTEANAAEPVAYSRISVQSLNLAAKNERGLQVCTTNTKNDSRIFFTTLDWFDESLAQKGNSSLRYYDPEKNTTGTYPLELSIGSGAWPRGVPSDAYTVMSEIKGAQDEFAIYIFAWYARHSEDKDGMPTRCYPELIRVYHDGKRTRRNCDNIWDFRDAFQTIDGFPEYWTEEWIDDWYDPRDPFDPRYIEVMDYTWEGILKLPDFIAVEPLPGGECLFVWEEKTTDGKNSRLVGGYLENDGLGDMLLPLTPVPLRTSKELLQVILTGFKSNGYSYQIGVLYGSNGSSKNQLFEYFDFYQSDNVYDEVYPTLMYHKKFSEPIASVTHIPYVISADAPIPPLRYVLLKNAKDGSGLYTAEIQEMNFSGTAGKEGTGRRIDTGVTVSGTQLEAVHTGLVDTLYYLSKESDNGQTRFAVKAVYISELDNDPNNIFMSHPFHLGVFDAADVRESSGISGFRMIPRLNGFLNGLLVEDASTTGSGKRNYALKYFTLKQSLRIDLQGCAADRVLVKQKDNINLLFRVMNTGNVPVSEFSLKAYAVDGNNNTHPLDSITVKCQNPVESFVEDLTEEGHATVYGETAVSSYDSVLDDDMNHWLVTDSSGKTVPYVTTVLMPDEIHNYRCVFRVPEKFKGNTYRVYLELESITVAAAMNGNGQLDATGVWPLYVRALGGEENSVSTSAAGVPVYMVTASLAGAGEPALPSGSGASGPVPVTLTVKEPDGPLMSLSGEGGDRSVLLSAFENTTTPDTRRINLDTSDLSVRAQYALNQTEKIAHIVVRNNSSTPMSGIQLHVSVDGKETWGYAFEPSYSLDNTETCSLDIPVVELTGGIGGDTLEFTVSGDGNDVIRTNNTDTLPLNGIFRIIRQPEDQTVPEGSNAAFSVAAAGGTKPYAHQWQVSESRYGPWTDLKGENGSALNLTGVKRKQNGLFYRCVITDADGRQLISRAAMLLVNKVPHTGDGSNPAFWMTGMLVSVLAAVFMMNRRRKRNLGGRLS